jgi:hypothetical protein
MAWLISNAPCGKLRVNSQIPESYPRSHDGSSWLFLWPLKSSTGCIRCCYNQATPSSMILKYVSCGKYKPFSNFVRPNVLVYTGTLQDKKNKKNVPRFGQEHYCYSLLWCHYSTSVKLHNDRWLIVLVYHRISLLKPHLESKLHRIYHLNS